MKKYSYSSENRLGYKENYEEIIKYKIRSSTQSENMPTRETSGDPRDVILSRGVRWFLFILFIFLQLLMNIDHGTFPAATEEIRLDLDIDDNILGIFGSLVFLGNLIGSLISISFINLCNRKILLLFSLVLNSICLYTFTITKIVWVLFLNRIIAFVSIYLPVWCDQFGMKNKKTMMISLIQVGSPLGVVAGYFLTFWIKDTMGWSYSFIIQAIMVGATVMILIFIPSIYFSSTLSIRKRTLENIMAVNQASSFDDDLSIYRNSLVESRLPSADANDFQTKFRKKSPPGLFKNLCMILKHKIYLFSALSLSSLFFVITAVQYWGSDYMEKALHVQDKNLRLLSFSIICITSPTFGVIFGGWTISKIGGYESKHSILLCFIYASLASIFSLPVPFFDDLTKFTIFLWFVLFFGGAIVPPLTGIIISTLPNNLRGSANSVTCFLSNLLGYLPAPFVYGTINETYKISNPKIAFFFIMYYSVSGVLFLFIALIFRYRYFGMMNLETSKNLLSDRKQSKLSRHDSLIDTGTLAKIFGNYQNFDEKLLEESDDHTDQQNEQTESKQTKIEETFVIEEKPDDESGHFNIVSDEKSHSDHKKNYTPLHSNHMSLLTPQFNFVQSQDFDYLNKFSNYGDKFSKEESVFAPGIQNDVSDPSSRDEKEEKNKSIQNLNIQVVSQSYKEKSLNSLDKEVENASGLKRKTSDGIKNIKSIYD